MERWNVWVEKKVANWLLHIRRVYSLRACLWGWLSLCGSLPFSLQRAVLQAKKKLEEQGHELVPFKVPSPIDAFALYAGSVTGDGGYYIFNKMKTVSLLPWSWVCYERIPSGSADSRMQDRLQHNASPFLGAPSRGSIRQIWQNEGSSTIHAKEHCR